MFYLLFLLPSTTEDEGGDVFNPLCLFVTCKIEDFSSLLVNRFCYSVCLFVCLSPTGHNFKPIFTKLHHMVEFVIWKKQIVFEVKRSARPKVNNFGGISKILNFHQNDLKFEKILYFSSLNSTSQLFLKPTWTKRST